MGHSVIPTYKHLNSIPNSGLTRSEFGTIKDSYLLVKKVLSESRLDTLPQLSSK